MLLTTSLENSFGVFLLCIQKKKKHLPSPFALFISMWSWFAVSEQSDCEDMLDPSR